MKMVAAARLKRAEDRARTIKPYADRLQSFMDSFTINPENLPHPLAEVRTHVNHSGLLVLTSDKGLCGSYNSNILRGAQAWMKDRDLAKVRVYALGRKAWDSYKKHPEINVAERFINFDQTLPYKEVKNLVDLVSSDYIDGKIDELFVLYTHYVSPAVCRPTLEHLLPIVSTKEKKDHEDHADFIIEPSPEAVLGILFPKFVYTRILMALAHSFASEQGQRMVAMTNATDSAKEMVENLTLVYNKVRQAAITREISEIVGGSEALKK